MEALQSDAARKGARVFDDPSMRLAGRPKQGGGGGSADRDAAQRRRGRAFEDLGSTFAPKSKQGRAPLSVDSAKSSTGTAGRGSTATQAGGTEASGKPTRAFGAAASIVVSNGSSDSSDDELDCLSQPPSSPKKPRKENRIKQDAVVVDGKTYPYHPKFRPESSSVIQTLKFKKNLKTAKRDGGASGQPAKSVAFASSPGSKENVAGGSSVTPIFVDFYQASQSSSTSSVALSQSSTLKDGSPSRRSRAPSFPSTSSKPNDSTRPRPRPVRHTKSPTRPPSPGIPLPNRDKTLSPTPKRKLYHNSNSNSKAPAPFPAMPPLSSRMDFPALAQKGEDAPKAKHLPFPLSPPQSKSSSSSEPRIVAPNARKKGETRVKPKKKGKRKEKQRSDLGSDSDVVVGQASTSGLKAQPFPMSTQMLNSIETFSPPRQIGLSSKKRLSEELDDDGGRKKSRKSDELYIGSIMHHDDDVYEEEDTVTIASMTDPSMLCPFCDAPLPPEPTPCLARLIQSMIRSSLPDPRPGNPLGRKAPFSRYIVVCQRHLFETTSLPRARAQGWPQAIDWARLGARVERMKDALRALIDDRPVAHPETQPSPRAACVFWREVMEEVRKMGVRVATGSHGQMDSFKKALPGYYGELGSVIIHQTLYDMFPLTSFNSESIAPLTANEFVQRILVPEAALRLIMEDKDLRGSRGRDDALEIMRQSADYGAQMFPEDGAAEQGSDVWLGGNGGDNEDDGDDTLGAGDAIVMERARKRRKELEEEDKMEQEREMKAEKLRREAEEARRKRGRGKGLLSGAKTNAKPKSSPKGKGKGKAREDEDGASDASTQARPKPRPVARPAKSAREVSNGTDDEEEDRDEDNEMVGRILTLDVTDYEDDMNYVYLDASDYDTDDRPKVKKKASSRTVPAPRGGRSSSESERSPPSSGDEYGGPTRVAKSSASRQPPKTDKSKHQPAPRSMSTRRAQARTMEEHEADVVVATSPRASTRAGSRKKRDKDKECMEVSDDEDEAPEPPTSSIPHPSSPGAGASKGKTVPPLFAARHRKITKATGSSPRKSAPSESAEWDWLLND